MIGYPLGVTRYIQQVANKRPPFRARREGKILAFSVPSEEKGEYNRSCGKESEIDHGAAGKNVAGSPVECI